MSFVTQKALLFYDFLGSYVNEDSYQSKSSRLFPSIRHFSGHLKAVQSTVLHGDGLLFGAVIRIKYFFVTQ